MEMANFIGLILPFVVLILILRLFGAWMLRINDVIKAQKETNKLLEQILEEQKKNHPPL